MAFFSFERDVVSDRHIIRPTGTAFSLAGYKLLYRSWLAQGSPVDKGWHTSADEPTRIRRSASILCIVILTLLFNPACIINCSADCCTGELKPKSGALSWNTYVWDGKKLKPKSGATSENTWLFDGEEIKRASGAKSGNTYVWTGSRFYPKSGATSANTWTWDGKELKPLSGARSENTWVFDHCQWKLKQGATSKNSWVVTGFVPVPVSALVLLGLN